MKNKNLNPKITLAEFIRTYMNYARRAKETGHKPVSILRFRQGRL